MGSTGDAWGGRMSAFPYDVNTAEGRAQVRDLVTRGLLPRVPLCTEIIAAQLDVDHTALVHWDIDWETVCQRFGLADDDLGKALVERGILIPLEGIWIAGDNDEDFFAGALAAFSDEELAEELRC